MRGLQGWGELLFVDGLHLTPEGNRLVIKEVLAAVASSYPELK